MTDLEEEMFREPDGELRLPKPGLYRHFRNRKLYRHVGFAKHSETEELLVLYVPLYAEGQAYTSPASFMARPATMWAERVEWAQDFADQINGGANPGPRFKRVGD